MSRGYTILATVTGARGRRLSEEPGIKGASFTHFGRLTAWQNWIFQRDNAVGERGALTLYGTGVRVDFDRRRV